MLPKFKKNVYLRMLKPQLKIIGGKKKLKNAS